MSEFIDREEAISKIKAAYCCGCNDYNGVKCRACQIMDAMDVLEDAPAVNFETVRMQWRKTAENPPKQEDTDPRSATVLTVQVGIGFVTAWEWHIVADFPEEFPIWMPMPKGLPRPAHSLQRQLKAQRIFTNAHHAAERISRNDFNKEGWMGGKRR